MSDQVNAHVEAGGVAQHAGTQQDDGGLTALVMQCTFAVLAGQKTVTTSSTAGKAPVGFPRGELLSVGTNGARNYAVCPIKVLAWVHARTTKAAATPRATHPQQEKPNA